MSNAGLPGKPQKSQTPSFDDIPEAQREFVDSQRKPRSKQTVWFVGFGLASIAIAAGGLAVYQFRLSSGSSHGSPPASSPAASPTTSAGPSPNSLLGHFAYQEAPQAELEPVSDDGGMKLRSAAAKAFREMVVAAGTEGVKLVPLSAYRSMSEQQQVYFDVKAERGQTPTERAQVSAPPGYSEHHTGYAVDIGDGSVPATNLSPNFEETAAFKWLQANATRFNFEMSFPKDNKQGVTYEPWHWRFVGDRQSLETFYKARNMQ